MARLPRPIVNIVSVVASICLTLAVMEIAFRVFKPQQCFNVKVSVWDRTLGIRHIPGAKGVIAGPEFKTIVAINSRGLRDGEYPHAKPDGVRRILCLGDSYTFGYGVEAEQAFPKVLEDMLNAGSGGAQRWEVLNAGVISTGTAHQLAFFDVDGYKYQPDFVLLAICGGNDLIDNNTCGLYSYDAGGLHKHDAALSRTDKLVYVVQRLPGYVFFSSHSHLMTFAKMRILGSLARHAGSAPAAQDETPAGVVNQAAGNAEAALELTEQLLLALRGSCRRRGAELIVTIVPQPLSGTRQEMMARLAQFLEAEQFAYVDLFPRFGKAPGELPRYELPYYYPADHHWTAEGNRAAAEALCAYFEHLPTVQALH